MKCKRHITRFRLPAVVAWLYDRRRRSFDNLHRAQLLERFQRGFGNVDFVAGIENFRNGIGHTRKLEHHANRPARLESGSFWS